MVPNYFSLDIGHDSQDFRSGAGHPVVGVIMGSSSDWEVMKHAVAMLEDFGVPYEAQVISAHRMPQDMAEYGAAAHARGLRGIIAGAGGAAHLPGMMAALTEVPVFGVPVPSKYLRGEDSLLSIVQMPKGVPVATFAIGEAGAANAAPARDRHAGRHGRRPASEAGGVPRPPDAGRARHEGSARGLIRMTQSTAFSIAPAAGSACWAAASWAACSVTPPRAWAKVAVLDPAEECPAGMVADLHIRAAYDDEAGLARLAQQCRAVTTEFENVPADSLRALAARCRVSPAADAVAVVQDRIAEKPSSPRRAFPSSPHAAIRGEADLRAAPANLFPGILRVARMGYDGKGQARIATREEALAAYAEFGGVPCVLEALMPLDYEISVVLARGFDGASVVFPVARNVHRDGILAVSTASAAGQTRPTQNARPAPRRRRSPSRRVWATTACCAWNSSSSATAA